MEEFELEPGERVTRSVRKHWFVFMLELIPFALLALFPLVLNPLLSYLATVSPAIEGMHISLAGPWARLLLGSWWLLMWTGLFNAFTRYYLDLWVITTIRIVNIHQHHFFSREVSSFLLNRVQDVTTEVSGFFPTLIGFGSLRVETAGDASRHFGMKGIPDPQGIRDLIMREIADLNGKPE